MLASFGILFMTLLVLGVPIFLSMLIPSIITLLAHFPSIDQGLVIQRIVGGIDTFSLLSIPFFMYAADIMSKGNIGKKLVNFANSLVGHIPGGLAVAAVVTCTIFGAISGAGPAAIVAVGLILYPALIKNGYSESFSTSVITSSSTLAMLIPPGIAMILFCVSSGASVGKLFMSGLSVGLVVAVAFSIYVIWYAIKYKIPRQKRSSIKEIFMATKDAFWSLGLPAIILGGIYFGVMTPTEASAVAVAYVIFIEMLIYKSVTIKDIFEIGVTSGRMVAMIFVLIGAGSLLSWIMTAAQVPQAIISLTSGASKLSILLIINIIFLIAGMFIDPNSMVIVLTPLVLPLAQSVNIDPLHLGIMIVLDAAVGMLTPPFGLNIFVSIATFKQPYEKIVPPLIPYIIIMFLVLILIIFVPQIALFLPNTMK